MPNNQEYRGVFIAIAIGQKYLDNFNKEFRPSFERFAKKYDLEFVVADQQIRPSGKHPAWQKLLIFDHPRVAPYDRAMFLDADVYITKHARNPFSALQGKPWGVVDNNPYGLESLSRTDPELYAHCPEENRPDKLVNTGMFIVSKELKPMLEMIFDEYPEQLNWENGPLSYHLLNDGKGVLLPAEFNTIFFCFRSAYGWGLSSILKMYHENSFIHFAGNKGMMFLPLIRYIDTHDKTVLKSIIYFAGKESFDPITTPLLKWAEFIRGAYRYHIKRRISKLFAS